MMNGWSYPEISLEDVMNLIKGFVDILILATGYQSSGRIAHWDAQSVKKVFQWGLFFENLLKQLISFDDYKDSIKELDAALLEITSSNNFPQGLAHLSSATFVRAREFVLAHLLHTLPLREENLRAIMSAVTDLDLDEIGKTESACLDAYVSNLSLIQIQDKQCLTISSTSSSNNYPNAKIGSCTNVNLTKCTVQELLKRQFSVSCVSSAHSVLEVLSKNITSSNLMESDNTFVVEYATDSLVKDQTCDYLTWNRWRSNSLSYMMHKRTIRLVSGASMIFSTPKAKWTHIFDQLSTITETKQDLFETMELLLLGCISSRWSCILDHLMKVTYDSITILKQYRELGNLLIGRSQSGNAKEKAVESKESGIFEYLSALMDGQLHLLWKLSPLIAAIAIPSWSSLFKIYLSEIERQFKGDSSKIRCCTCIQEKKDHKECELAERIWCLYIFHFRRVPCDA